ncbi:MAG: DUF2974 domain-containing protein [Clostridiales bacterium]|nr:DUF2974 domain-containing protein [Clostridiales bacterium]
MANILDYLDWRGDLTFQAAAFNEVDNLLLAQLVYVAFDGIVEAPESGERITVKEASARFFASHDEKKIMEQVSQIKTAIYVLKKMAKTKRFADAKLFAYVNEISRLEESQFAVICVELSDNSVYVAFRGTDSTIVGWKENFNMGYLSTTPGQRKAADYLNRMEFPKGKKLRVGGHSKGGNLSVYAAVKCSPCMQEKILEVYSNDGPGFSREMLESEAYQRMLPKIKTILPESSIVGMLLEHQGEFEVVKSSQRGIQQHDPMSWEVLGAAFVPGEGIAQGSILLDETLKNWIVGLDKEQRQQLVDTVFDILDEADIRTLDDLCHSKWKTVQELMRAKSKLAPETQKLFLRAIKLLWKSGNDAIKRTVKKTGKEMTS